MMVRDGDFGREAGDFDRAAEVKGEEVELKASNAERFGGLPERAEGDFGRVALAKGELDPEKALNPDLTGIGAA